MQAICFSFLHQFLAPRQPLSFKMAIPTAHTGAALVFGYFYWTYGWEAAVLCHVFFDTAAPVIMALGWSRFMFTHSGAKA
jgi:hypothetical protein